MRFSLRPFAVFTAISFCLGACSAAFAGNPKALQPAPADAAAAAPAVRADVVTIPGPLRSFLRMAGISQEAAPENVLPLLARNVALRGYEGQAPTEFLLLLDRYVEQARELRQLTAGDGTLQVANCEDATRVIAILGYRFHDLCGQKSAYLITAHPERAFLTVDSGFPLTELGEAMRNDEPFSYPFPAAAVPVLFHDRDWMALSNVRRKGGGDLLDVLLHDENFDRLYWAFSRESEETRLALLRSPGLRTLLSRGPALDFYGSEINIHGRRVVVPGGPGAERAWEELVGASPKDAGPFVEQLLTRDRGWMAAWYDAIARVSEAQQVRLTEKARFRRMYDFYRGAAGETSATRGVFPRNARLLMLFTGLQWDSAGEPLVPGNLRIWKEILSEKTVIKPLRDWARRRNTLNRPDQLLESLVACSQTDTNTGPLEIYRSVSEMDSVRAPGAGLSDATIRLLADNFTQFHSWYLIFSEFSGLNDASITLFVKAARAVDGIPSPTLRSNALGALQANLGLWQILARQQQIPAGMVNASWQSAMQPFTGISSSVGLFQATRSSLQSVLQAAGGDADMSEDQIIDLLAGPAQESAIGQRVHRELAARMRAVLDDQRLVSVDTLFGLYDGLNELAHGSPVSARLIPLAGSLREFELPRPIFSESERIAWAPQIYSSRHAELQVRTDLTRVIRSPGSPQQLEAARGQLTPFLRDTLVGLNYSYYEPPGAQVLHHNPLFVRAHDFSGGSIQGFVDKWDPPELIGIGVTAGGGAYLIGSLTNLPYALATTEEDFIAPVHVQALIWQAVVPALMVDAIQPRWWDVSATEMHGVALYQKYGEELLTAAAGNAELRQKVLDILSDGMGPKRLEMTEQALLHPGDVPALIPKIYPVESFELAAEFRKRYPAETGSWGAAGRELDELARKDPSQVSEERLSRDFGAPHPVLAQTNGCGLMVAKPMPAYEGTPNRLLGESWESDNLYWARLADELGYAPATLNILVPELTRHMIAKIFATDLEDWPALLRAMEQTGQDFREGRIRIPAAGNLVQQ